MAMSEYIEKIIPFWQKENGCGELLQEYEKNSKISLPDDFKDFLYWSNGGVGVFSNSYIDIWKIENFEELRRDYAIEKYLGQYLIPFGSNGAAICFLFDYRNAQKAAIVSVDFGDLDLDELKPVANSFSELLDLAISGELNSDDL